MTDTAAEFSVFCPGVLEVLSIGKGDLRLEVGGERGDKAKARRLIEEMLQKGYAIFVETDEGLVRVKRFDPRHMVYVVSELLPERDAAGTPSKRSGRRQDRRVPVAGSRATAVGRTSGG